jgi:hypothetical protein
MLTHPRSFRPGVLAAGVLLVIASLVTGQSANNTRHSAEQAVFNGKTLAGWHTIGGADWKVENGNIVGTVRNGAEGWLVLDTVYGNAELSLSFDCNNCQPGVLIRSEKSGSGTSGVYLPLSGNDVAILSRVALDASGKITSSTPLPKFAGMADIKSTGPDFLITGGCSPVPCAGIKDAHGGGIGGAGSLAQPRPPALVANGANSLTLSAGGEVFAGSVNGGRVPGAKMDSGHPYGQFALHLAGPNGASMRVTKINVQDNTTRVSGLAPEYTDPKFKKVQLSDVFYAEGVNVGDINHDGKMDIVAGAFYYLGPDFREAHEIYPPAAIAVAGSEYPGGPPVPQAGSITHGNYPPSFMSWVYDFNGDGWPDIFMVMSFGPRPTFSGHLFINPKGEHRHWDNYQVIPLITNEANQFVDVDGDGKPELSMQLATDPGWADAQVGYAKPDWSDPTKPWKFIPVSEHGRWSGHGLATGDVNKDGRMDLVSPAGWWEQPATNAAAGNWKYHQARFGGGGADIYVYDVNGDGLNDIVTSLAAHGPGLAWFEQRKDGTFEQHTIMRAPADATNPGEVAFTELHALVMTDIDGDGLQDIVTGKRWYSHGYRYDEENDIDDPPVLYWFKLVRKGNQATFEPHMIDNRSGLGVQIVAKDVDGDGKTDIVTSARKGTFVFFNHTH